MDYRVTNEDGSESLVAPDGREQWRFTAAPGGGFFAQRPMGRGLYHGEAYALHGDGLNGSDIPTAVWDQRETYATDQHEAEKVLTSAGIDLAAPLADSRGHESRDVRLALAQLNEAGYVLVWPAAEVDALCKRYIEQWESGGAGGPEHQDD